MTDEYHTAASPSLIDFKQSDGFWKTGQRPNSGSITGYISPAQTAPDMGIESAEFEARLRETTSDAKPASVWVPYLGLPTTDKERKRLQLWTFLMGYFPDTFLAVANVAIVGNEQHNPGEPLHWAREKSTDQMNTAFRHQFDYGRGVKKDTDGQWHLAKAIWRLSAQLQLDIEAERNGNQ